MKSFDRIMNTEPSPSVHPLGEKRDACTGCAACAASCPVSCITMRPDHEGFLQPHIEMTKCTTCGFCTQTCPALLLNPSVLNETLISSPTVYAAWHLDPEIRRQSSSGGVFSALAENILDKGGVVAGAAFDEHLVVRHILIESSKDLHKLRGSKYVQSDVPLTLYRQIRNHLKQGRSVLFSGTPCQVAGLRGFLRHTYTNLFCCDIICHGVPTPFLLEKYIQAKQKKGNELKAVYFRDKAYGWKKFAMRLVWQQGERCAKAIDSYLLAFLRDYALRPCCYQCAYTTISRQGDLTIADFWSVAQTYPDFDQDDKGTSLVLANTKKGQAWLVDCQVTLFCGSADLDTAISGNPTLIRSVRRPAERETFLVDLKKFPFDVIIRKYRLYGPTRVQLMFGFVKRIIKGIGRRLFRLNDIRGRK